MGAKEQQPAGNGKWEGVSKGDGDGQDVGYVRSVGGVAGAGAGAGVAEQKTNVSYEYFN